MAWYFFIFAHFYTIVPVDEAVTCRFYTQTVVYSRSGARYMFRSRKGPKNEAWRQDIRRLAFRTAEQRLEPTPSLAKKQIIRNLPPRGYRVTRPLRTDLLRQRMLQEERKSGLADD